MSFERLREKFGNHTEAAKALGITPESYRRVRRTGVMSGSLHRLILLLSSSDQFDESGHPLPSSSQPHPDEAA